MISTSNEAVPSRPAETREPITRFSVVITSHNQRSFIGAAVDSAISQVAGLREVIVVDDGSSDGSPLLLQEYGDAIRFLPLKENRGAIAARNYGASHARGEYLVFLDGDDLLMPWALDVYDRIIRERKPTVILARTAWFSGDVPQTKDEDRPGHIESAYYPALIRKDRSIGLSASAYIVDRETFWEAGGWTPGIFHLDSQDLCTKLGLRPMVLVSSPATVHYRVHGANSIMAVPPFLRNVRLLVQKERDNQYPGGREHRFDRSAWFGGLIAFWIKRAMRAGLYKDAVKLALFGWPMVLAAVVRRSAVGLKGRQPIETIELRLDRSGK